jgi:hypothetical protein
MEPDCDPDAVSSPRQHPPPGRVGLSGPGRASLLSLVWRIHILHPRSQSPPPLHQTHVFITESNHVPTFFSEKLFSLKIGFANQIFLVSRSERARCVAISSLRLAMLRPSPALRGRPSQKGRVLVWSPIAIPTQFRRHDNTLIQK